MKFVALIAGIIFGCLFLIFPVDKKYVQVRYVCESQTCIDVVSGGEDKVVRGFPFRYMKVNDSNGVYIGTDIAPVATALDFSLGFSAGWVPVYFLLKKYRSNKK